MADRISSLDDAYETGDLSIFPLAIDDKDILYEATNNSETRLKQTLSFNGKVVIVDDTSGFPKTGQIRISREGTFGLVGIEGQQVSELIFYGKKTSNTFQDLKRGFSGSRQSIWPAKKSIVTNSVVADHHNTIKDAVVNIEIDLGTKISPNSESLNGILKNQEVRFLAPKPLFRAFPIKGTPPLKVRFQNFSTGSGVRFLWDFGDGGTSLERSPNHTYLTEGAFTVKLNIITITGAQGIATKTDYIISDRDESVPFFYVNDISNPFSVQTADALTAGIFPPLFVPTPTDPKEFLSVDQSDGDIIQRNWIFGDGQTFTEEDPDRHEVTHIYEEPGEFNVTELVIFSNGRLKRVVLPEPLVVI